MASGVRHFGSVLGAQVVMLFVGLASQSCLAWLLGTAGRGSYAVCLMYATLLSIFFVVGCDVASVYFVSSKRFNISEGITYTIVYGGIGSAGAVIAGMALMQLPLSIFDKATPDEFHIALVSIPIALFSLVLLRLLTAVGDFEWFAVLSVIGGVAHLLFTLLFVWGFLWGVKGALLAIIATGFLTVLMTLIFFRLKYKATLVRPTMKNLLGMFHYGARYYIGKISNNVNFQIGTIILAFFATKEQVGIFAVATQLTSRAMIIPDTLTTVLIPKVASDERGKKHIIAQCSRLTGLICGVLLLILAVFAKPIVTLIFGPGFIESALLIQILSVGVVVRCACKIFVPYLLGTNRPGTASISVAAGMIVNLTVLWLLLPILGLPGAALGVTASYIVSSTILMFAFRKYSGLKLQTIWSMKRSDWNMLADLAHRAASSVKRVLFRNQMQQEQDACER